MAPKINLLWGGPGSPRWYQLNLAYFSKKKRYSDKCCVFLKETALSGDPYWLSFLAGCPGWPIPGQPASPEMRAYPNLVLFLINTRLSHLSGLFLEKNTPTPSQSSLVLEKYTAQPSQPKKCLKTFKKSRPGSRLSASEAVLEASWGILHVSCATMGGHGRPWEAMGPMGGQGIFDSFI